MEYEDWIENEINNLMEEGSECYPFTEDNIKEALSEMKSGGMFFITTSIAVAAKQPNNPVSQDIMNYSIMVGIKGYWEDLAKHMAEKNWERHTYMLDVKRHA